MKADFSRNTAARTVVRCLAVAGALALATLPVQANELKEQIRSFAETQIRAWASDPVVIEAVKAQNARNAALTQADIDRLDKQWRAETKAAEKPLINKVLSNRLSAYLKKIKADGKGIYTEIFVMDNKGLNVGQSDVTSDYWQGDEAKWKKSFLAGPDAIFVDEIKEDESTQQFQSQVSIPIVDPATNSTIGAVTVGINVDEMS